MSRDGQPTIYVVDDDEAVRASLKWLIESVNLPVRCFGSAHEFLAKCPEDGAGCLVLDVRMPGMSGLELQDHLRRRGWTLPVLIITGHADVPMAVRAMRAGAADFIEKPFNDQALIERIQQAIERDAATRRDRSALAQVRLHFTELSKREREVFELVVAGKTNRVIAKELSLSEKTIEVHRSRVMQKMNAGSLAELVRMHIALTTDTHEDA